MASEENEHTYPVSVCIGDTDAYSMVYHSNYLKFFEVCQLLHQICGRNEGGGWGGGGGS
jgi:hypothetical protein